MKKITALTLFGLLAGLLIANNATGDPKEFRIPPPTVPERKYPCMKCHEIWAYNEEKRELKMNHAEKVLKHAEERQWCLNCHDTKNRNKLRLLNQQLIDFETSHELCGQCHGTIFRDWKAGVHGKRIGMWNGEKLYRLCIHCHNPHQPKFEPVKPQSRPIKPIEINN